MHAGLYLYIMRKHADQPMSLREKKEKLIPRYFFFSLCLKSGRLSVCTCVCEERK